jgi:hypothetical protein
MTAPLINDGRGSFVPLVLLVVREAFYREGPEGGSFWAPYFRLLPTEFPGVGSAGRVLLTACCYEVCGAGSATHARALVLVARHSCTQPHCRQPLLQ